jgi:hypothetical protein
MFANLPNNYATSFVDDEGDRIVISSDAELAEAFRVAVADNRKCLRLDVSEIAPITPNDTDEWDVDIGRYHTFLEPPMPLCWLSVCVCFSRQYR